MYLVHCFFSSTFIRVINVTCFLYYPLMYITWEIACELSLGLRQAWQWDDETIHLYYERLRVQFSLLVMMWINQDHAMGCFSKASVVIHRFESKTSHTTLVKNLTHKLYGQLLWMLEWLKFLSFVPVGEGHDLVLTKETTAQVHSKVWAQDKEGMIHIISITCIHS